MWRLEPVPPSLRGSPFGGVDRLFARSLAASAAAGAAFSLALLLVPARPALYESIEAMPERLARLIVEPPAPAPAAPPAASPSPATSPAPRPAEPAPLQPAAPTARRAGPATSGPATSPPAGGARGRERAEAVAGAVEAGNLLGAVDAMVSGLSSVVPAGTGGAARGADAGAGAAALAAASRRESGGEAIARAAATAGSRSASAPLARAAVAIEDIAPAGASPARARSPEALMAAVHRYAGGIKHCYDEVLRERAATRGRLVLLITVAPSGAVARLQMAGDTVRDPELEECVLGQVRAWKFPPSTGEPVSFRCPLVFTPPEE